MRQRDARRIAYVTGLMIHHLVARIDKSAARQVQPLAHAHRDDDLILRHITDRVIPLNVFVDRPAQLDQAEVGRVMRLALLQRVDARLADVPRRVKIRFADAERNGVFHLGDNIKKIADA